MSQYDMGIERRRRNTTALIEPWRGLCIGHSHTQCQTTIRPLWEALTLLSPHTRFLAQCTAELSSNLHPDAQAERLADARQEVRLVASEVLLKLLAALGADAVLPRLSRFWTHRSWKV